MTRLIRFDWALKNILREKANFEILEGFLSELLHTDVKIDSILESESNKESDEDKSNRVDILVETSTKEKIIIEVQCRNEWDYLSRMLYGTSKAITSYIQKGEPYKKICKVISVSIVFFELCKGKDYVYKGTTIFTGMHYNDILTLGENEKKMYEHKREEVSDIFPEYYIIKVNTFDQQIRDKFDEWVYFLKTEQIKETFKAKGLKQAADKLNVLKLNEKEARIYENYLKDLSCERSELESAFVSGRVEGEAKGEAKGRAEGKAEGAKSKAIEIAKALKANDMPITNIAAITGLSIDEIKKL
jgi:predicted transposase/invertase (TIGR01784 family)